MLAMGHPPGFIAEAALGSVAANPATVLFGVVFVRLVLARGPAIAMPAALTAWYRDCLGVDLDEHGLWRPDAGPLVFAAFDADTDELGPVDQQTMINFRVADLDAMLAQLREHGAAVADEIQDLAGVGRFGWVSDPDGRRIELWQPSGD